MRKNPYADIQFTVQSKVRDSKIDYKNINFFVIWFHRGKMITKWTTYPRDSYPFDSWSSVFCPVWHCSMPTMYGFLGPIWKYKYLKQDERQRFEAFCIADAKTVEKWRKHGQFKRVE